ncbi:MAG TPA: hypothetical protein VH374_15205 [Polyangia bacterium]|nr:hypothetical protein [Polyangia bacterium]
MSDRAASAVNAHKVGRSPAADAATTIFHRRRDVIAATTCMALWRPFHTAG